MRLYNLDRGIGLSRWPPHPPRASKKVFGTHRPTRSPRGRAGYPQGFPQARRGSGGGPTGGRGRWGSGVPPTTGARESPLDSPERLGGGAPGVSVRRDRGEPVESRRASLGGSGVGMGHATGGSDPGGGARGATQVARRATGRGSGSGRTGEGLGSLSEPVERPSEGRGVGRGRGARSVPGRGLGARRASGRARGRRAVPQNGENPLPPEGRGRGLSVGGERGGETSPKPPPTRAARHPERAPGEP